MNAGIVQQVDTPQALYDTPNNLFVAGFIGSPQMNFLDAVVSVEGDNAVLDLGESKITLSGDKAKKLIDGGYEGKTVVMGIRPEDVYDDEAVIAANPGTTIESTVRVYELLGAEVYLYFDYAGANFTARVKPTTTARTGDTVKLALEPSKIHVFDKETEVAITN
jgi:multiple sugar transport system ATP-binding protein